MKSKLEVVNTATKRNVGVTVGEKGWKENLYSWLKDPKTRQNAAIGATSVLVPGMLGMAAYRLGDVVKKKKLSKHAVKSDVYTATKLAKPAFVAATAGAIGGTFVNPFVGAAVASTISSAPYIYGEYKIARHGSGWR